MKKFLTLLNKELRELLTLQMLVPMVVGVLFFVFIGNVVGSETKKIQLPQSVVILDNDNTVASRAIIGNLKNSNLLTTTFTDSDIKSVLEMAKKDMTSTVISIPKGFEKGLSTIQAQKIDTYSIINNFSLTAAKGSATISTAIAAMNEYVSNNLIKSKVPGIDPKNIKNPITKADHVVIGSKSANIGAEQISSFILSQSIFIPIVMFIIIMFAAQMIAVSVASEKENKTLETLLSTPISRVSLVSAKMIAAGLVSLLLAVIYMFGFRYYINGMTGTAGSAEGVSSVMPVDAINQLGLSLDLKSYILLGLSLFLSILVALALSTILGAFAEDVKKVQGLILPITFLVMVPYILTMFVDMNSASPLIKTIIYIIPFSHPFLASPNLFLHDYGAVLLGIGYQAVVFSVLVFIAARIFSTDKILTMKLNFRKKSMS